MNDSKINYNGSIMREDEIAASISDSNIVEISDSAQKTFSLNYSHLTETSF